MPGFASSLSNKNDVVFAKNADFTLSAEPDSQNGLILDGQLWIGHTDVNEDAQHVFVGTLTSPNNSITFGYSSPNITAVVNTSVIIDLHTARYIVSPNGLTDGANYTTIQSAITAAAAAGGKQDIFIQPGTYTESITMVDGITLVAYNLDSVQPNVTIVGLVLAPSTGTIGFEGIKFAPGEANFYNAFGKSTNANFKRCNFIQTSFIGLINGSGTINFYDCTGDQGSALGNELFKNISGGTVNYFNCQFTNSGGNAIQIVRSSGSPVLIDNCIINGAVLGSTVTIINSLIDCSAVNVVAVQITGVSLLTNSYFNSGTASCLKIDSTATATHCTVVSSNANAITGAGTLNFCNLAFTGTSSTINASVQVPRIISNNAVKTTIPGAYPYTALPQDYIIYVDTSAARTINLNASPVTGQTYRIKDNVGTAGANNITVTPAAGTIDSAASFVINSNWGSIDVNYNGTSWRVL